MKNEGNWWIGHVGLILFSILNHCKTSHVDWWSGQKITTITRSCVLMKDSFIISNFK